MQTILRTELSHWSNQNQLESLGLIVDLKEDLSVRKCSSLDFIFKISAGLKISPVYTWVKPGYLKQHFIFK